MRFITLCFVFIATCCFAQDTYYGEMAKANEALEAKDYVTYLKHMQSAVELGPDKVGRPYYLYALARAYAFNELKEKAISTLDQILQEGVETPMVFLSLKDPAFAGLADAEGMKNLLEKARNLPIQISPVRGQVFEVTGAGCNLALLVKEQTMLLVDTGYPEVADHVWNAVQEKFPGKQIRYLVNTHEHYDHVGGNSRLGENAIIVASAGVYDAIQKPSDFFSDFSIPGLPREEWPTLTFDERVTVYLSGEEVQIIALPAHSEGDSIVYFAQSHVLHMGDNFFPETTRLVNPGKHVKPFMQTFRTFLNSLPDDVVVMSGHADIVPLSRLEEMFQETEKPYLFVTRLMQQGKNLEEIKQIGEKEGYRAVNLEFFYNRLSE